MQQLVMKIRILCIGKLKSSYPISDLISFYQKRIKIAVDIIELTSKEPRNEQDMIALFSSYKNEKCWALDQRGKSWSEHDWAHRILQEKMQGLKSLNIMVGGSAGIPYTLCKSSEESIALGPVTWNHLLIRPMILDMLYRCEKIWENHPYSRT
ncbi:MAG: 23S rRNA (pseudouridine(1915)-N(3))-methyltransferase RlmH [Alphaproteobacteria bacterium]|nr:23S rRNA (pseudouridine(1915)-N(3))-methyltransferase RlmH [Alphaproteobacteria bacterium]